MGEALAWHDETKPVQLLLMGNPCALIVRKEVYYKLFK